MPRLTLGFAFVLLLAAGAWAVDPPPTEPATEPLSFMKNVAPLLVENCVGCHNPKKSEGKYDLTTFTKLAKGGQNGEDITLVPGKPDESYLVELLREGAEPRMPYKQPPLSKEAIATFERWVSEGAKFDGPKTDEDWVSALYRMQPVNIPESYPAALPLTALAFSPDGTDLLASGYHELLLWKIAEGTLEARYPGTPERVHSLARSPDGKWVASAGGNPGLSGTATLWKTDAAGKLEVDRVLVEGPDAFFAVAFSPDSTLVAAAGADRVVRVWKTDGGELVMAIEDHADWVLDLAFSPDGKRLATASRDKTSKVFDVEKKESLVTFPGHGASVNCVRFVPDGKQVVSAGDDQRLRIWNPDEDAKQTSEIGGFDAPIFRMLYSPDGKDLIACGADRSVRIFTDNKQRAKLDGHTDWVYALAITDDGQTLASGSWDGEIRLWSRADGKFLRSFLAAPGKKRP